MDRLKSWCAFLCMVPATIVLGTIASLLVLFPNRSQTIHAVSRLWAWLWCVLAGVKVHVIGKENLPEGPCILVSNHQSHFDVPALYLAIKKPLLFLAKRSLFKIPFFGWSMRIVGHIPVSHSRPFKSGRAIMIASARLKKSRGNLLVFAEGHRSGGTKLLPFKSGGFRLALHSGLPIVPVAVNGGYKVHMKGANVIHPGIIEVSILPPIQATGMADDDWETLKDRTFKAIEGVLQ